MNHQKFVKISFKTILVALEPGTDFSLKIALLL